MIDLELPLQKRTKLYRFFEMLTGILSYGMLLLLVILSLVSPLFAAVYLLLIIISMLVKAIGIAVHTITGRARLDKAQKVHWHERLLQLEDPAASHRAEQTAKSTGFGFEAHKENLRLMAADPSAFPKPSQLFNAVIIAAYSESYDIIEPTIQSVVDTTYNNDQIILILTCEERGGQAIRKTGQALKKKFEQHFKAFLLIEHPKDLPNEVIGKGGNITFAGRALHAWLDEQSIPLSDVIVTTLDSDNRPHPTYFDYVSYEYIVHENRKHLAFQPVSLYLNNIWDAPAPMRVIATGNSFWNIISSMRPHTLRNFASHSQSMEALTEMDFWSVRSIVEDGHQYWRSYFYFGGNYAVVPIYVPIYQDAVLLETYPKTLKAQFKQLRRWAYGASDVPYVATRIFSRQRNVPFWGSLARFLRLLDGHVTLACIPILIAVGGWVPLLINSQAARDIAAHQLPEVVSSIQRIALLGLLVTVFLAFKMLPPRPARYKRRRSIWMVLQWCLMPVTAILYNTMAAFNAQTHLLFGKYLDTFDLTEKATADSLRQTRSAKAGRASLLK